MKTYLPVLTLVAASVLFSASASAQDQGEQDCCAAPAATSAANPAANPAGTADATLASSSGSCPIIGQGQVQGQTVATNRVASSYQGTDGPACPSPGGSSCATPIGTSSATVASAGTPEDAVDQVVKYLENIRDTQEGGAIRLSLADMQQVLGFLPGRDDVSDAISVVFPNAMTGTGDGASRCSDYGACSLYGDLSAATGETLSMYETEKDQDGQEFDDFMLPSFSATTLDGRQVSSDELRGRPTLLVPLAVHCSHSYDTLPILHDLARKYGPQGLRVVGVLINSGTPEDATQSLAGFAACHDIWVTEGDTVGKVMQSRLVPSHFFVTADGHVVKKFVGFKNADQMKAEIESFLGA